MDINQIAIEITKLYLSKKILNNSEPTQFAKEFYDVYVKVYTFLKSYKISFNN